MCLLYQKEKYVVKLHSSALAKKSTMKTIFLILAKQASINIELYLYSSLSVN